MGNTNSSLLKTHYETLGITRTASPREVKEAYYRLVRQAHPDKLSSSPPKERLEAEERTKMLNEAYEVISDSEARATYDRTFLTRSYAAATPREEPAKTHEQKEQDHKQKQEEEQNNEQGKGTGEDWSFPGVVPQTSDYACMAQDFQWNKPWKPKDLGLRQEANKSNNKSEEAHPAGAHNPRSIASNPPSPPSSPCSSLPGTPELDPDSDSHSDDSLAADDSLASDDSPDAPMYEGLSPDDWIGLEEMSLDETAGWKPMVYSVKNVVSPYVYMRCAESMKHGRRQEKNVVLMIEGVVVKRGRLE